MQGGTQHGPSFGNALPQGLIQHKASSYMYTYIYCQDFIFFKWKIPLLCRESIMLCKVPCAQKHDLDKLGIPTHAPMFFFNSFAM